MELLKKLFVHKKLKSKEQKEFDETHTQDF